MAVNGAIADFFIIKKRLRTMPLFPLSHTVIGVALLSVFILAVSFYGFWRLNEAPSGKHVRVSVIQGNIEQDRKWDLAYQRAVFDTYKKFNAGGSCSFSLTGCLAGNRGAFLF